MTLKIDPAAPAQIHDVALGMRPRDFAEISALNFADTRPELAEILVARYKNNEDVLCGSWRGFPIVIGGFLQTRPNVLSMMMFATSEFPKIGYGITRFLKNTLMPRYEQAGIRRFEAISLDGYAEVHDWLRVLGLEAETGPLRNFGKNGESFVYFSKVVYAGPAGA